MKKLILGKNVIAEGDGGLGYKKFNDQLFEVLKIPKNPGANCRLIIEYYEYKRGQQGYSLLIISSKEQIKQILDPNKKPNDRQHGYGKSMRKN